MLVGNSSLVLATQTAAMFIHYRREVQDAKTRGLWTLFSKNGRRLLLGEGHEKKSSGTFVLDVLNNYTNYLSAVYFSCFRHMCKDK
eukprot:gene4288-3104_t